MSTVIPYRGYGQQLRFTPAGAARAIQAGFRAYRLYKRYKGSRSRKRQRNDSSVPRSLRSQGSRWMPFGSGLIQPGYRFRRRLTRRTIRARQLSRLGISAPASAKFVHANNASKFTISQGSKRMVFPFDGASYGIHSKNLLDAVATAESYTDPERKVCIAGVTDQYLFANQSNGGIYVTVRMMKFIRPWTTTYGTLASLIQNGFSEAGLNASGNQSICVSIYQNKKVNHYLKTVKAYKFFLAAGGVRRMYFTNKNVYPTSFQYKGESDTLYLKGEHVLFVEAYGTPVHDSTIDTNIDIAGSVIDIYQSIQLQYYPIDVNLYDNTVTDNITSVSVPIRFIDDQKTEQQVAT